MTQHINERIANLHPAIKSKAQLLHMLRNPGTVNQNDMLRRLANTNTATWPDADQSVSSDGRAEQ